jgi:excisionase family DNA binding protein
MANKKPNVEKDINSLELLRPKEVAEYLNLGLSTVYQYTVQGKLTRYRLSKKVTVYKKSDLDEFLKNALNADYPKDERFQKVEV